MPNRVEEMASKAMGKAKATKARVHGLTGIFKRLTEEHGEVSALLKRVSKSSDPEVRGELFPKIRKELLSHERGELSELYPLLREHSETREIVDEHNREAEELESLLDQLNARNFDSPEWGATFDQLVDAVEHHTSEEEENFFPAAQDALGEDQALALERSYEARKEAIARQID